MDFPRRFAAAQLIGAALVGLVNVALLLLDGAGVVHLVWEWLCMVAAGGMAAALGWLWPRSIGSKAFVAALIVLSTAAMGFLVGAAEERQAVIALHKLGFETDGAWRIALTGLYVLLTGIGVPVAVLLGGAARRRWWAASLLVLVGLAAIGLGHFRPLDEYEGIHAAAQWGIAGAFGGLMTSRFERWLPNGSGWTPRTRWLPGFSLIAFGLCVLLTPSNASRIALLSHPNSSGAWVLSSLWRPPPSESVRPPNTIDAALTPFDRPDQPVVVLLTIDAFRGDILRDGTWDEQLPNLAKLRASAAHFSAASAPSSGTAVSLTSLFTAKVYSQLEWRDHGNTRIRFPYPVDDPSPRFPEALTAAGVRTVSFISPPFLAANFGLARGFAEENRVDYRQHANADRLVGPLLTSVELHDARPGFFYAHIMDAHEPYDRGALKSGAPFDRYLSELALVDEWIGRFHRLLARQFQGRGYLIISADHGEAFDEHGQNYHSKNVYEEMTHVPLLVWGPGVPAGTIPHRVSLIDVGPTILDLFGLLPPEGMLGRTLLPLTDGTREWAGHAVTSEARKKRAYHVLSTGLKVIEDLRRKTVEIYDLANDPGESTNLYDADSPAMQRALGEARAWFERHDTGHSPYRR